MRYRIEGDQKFLRLPDGGEIQTDATDCEIELWDEIQKLRAALLNKRADDLCWIDDHDAARAQPLPAAEMLESCRRYVDQLQGERGVLCVGQMTIAQLESRVVELEMELESGHAHKD